MSNTITGRIAILKTTQVVSDKFSKREFVIETEGEYRQLIPIEFQQDKCSLLNNFRLGDEVEVGYNLRGRKWTSPQGEDKYFLTLQAWSIKSVSGNTVQSVALKDVQTDHLHTPQPTQYASGTVGDNLATDLPF